MRRDQEWGFYLKPSLEKPERPKLAVDDGFVPEAKDLDYDCELVDVQLWPEAVESCVESESVGDAVWECDG